MAYKNDLKERQAFAALERLQASLDEYDRRTRVREGCPKGWADVDDDNPTRPRKVSVTLRLDQDMAKWFWRQGEGYQSRMNAVLRAYMLAKAAKMA